MAVEAAAEEEGEAVADGEVGKGGTGACSESLEEGEVSTGGVASLESTVLQAAVEETAGRGGGSERGGQAQVGRSRLTLD